MKTVVLTLNRGLIDCYDNIPKGVEVVIRDYDIENYSENDLKKDENGNEYKEIIFGHLEV